MAGKNKGPIPIDSRSAAVLKSLHPDARPWFEALYQVLQHVIPDGWMAKFISGHRGMAEQNALYAQGRTKPGPIVTNASFGYSNHNFGLAIDVGLFDNYGRYITAPQYYRPLGPAGKKIGLKWGGDWKSKDLPHFEVPHGLSMFELRELTRLAKPIPVPKFSPPRSAPEVKKPAPPKEPVVAKPAPAKVAAPANPEPDKEPIDENKPEPTNPDIKLNGQLIASRARNVSGVAWIPARAVMAALGGKVYNVNSISKTLVIQRGTAATTTEWETVNGIGYIRARDLRHIGVDVQYVKGTLLLSTP